MSFEYDFQESGPRPTKLAYRYAYRSRFDRTIELVRAAADPPATVLDVGAGQGTTTLSLAELGYEVTWNDFRADLEGYVREKHTDGQVRYVPGNVFEADPGMRYDVVVATEVIEHVAHPDDFLRRLAGLLKPGGSIVLTTPNGQNFRNCLPRFSDQSDLLAFEAGQFKPDSDGHVFLLHEDELRVMARQAGLTIRSFAFFQTHLAYGVAPLAPSLLRSARGTSIVRLADSAAVRLPRVGQKLAVQMAARLTLPS